MFTMITPERSRTCCIQYQGENIGQDIYSHHSIERKGRRCRSLVELEETFRKRCRWIFLIPRSDSHPEQMPDRRQLGISQWSYMKLSQSGPTSWKVLYPLTGSTIFLMSFQRREVKCGYRTSWSSGYFSFVRCFKRSTDDHNDDHIQQLHTGRAALDRKDHSQRSIAVSSWWYGQH
jgi:hypothetical protein